MKRSEAVMEQDRQKERAVGGQTRATAGEERLTRAADGQRASVSDLTIRAPIRSDPCRPGTDFKLRTAIWAAAHHSVSQRLGCPGFEGPVHATDQRWRRHETDGPGPSAGTRWQLFSLLQLLSGRQTSASTVQSNHGEHDTSEEEEKMVSWQPLVLAPAALERFESSLQRWSRRGRPREQRGRGCDAAVRENDSIRASASTHCQPVHANEP